jgi:exopolyphosphatase/guanosine-5'-triphosphate,3'-diphosphate pyrophosphatase
MEQVERVRETARICFAQLADAWALSVDDHLQWLEWAITLCEIGLDIAHSHYQQHGAYIIENSDLAGFSRQEQLLLATLVFSHRRKLPLASINNLPDYWQPLAIKLATILRLAMILNRSRIQFPNQFELQARDKRIELRFATGWLDKYRLTKADLEQEIHYLQSADFELSIS